MIADEKAGTVAVGHNHYAARFGKRAYELELFLVLENAEAVGGQDKGVQYP